MFAPPQGVHLYEAVSAGDEFGRRFSSRLGFMGHQQGPRHDGHNSQDLMPVEFFIE
jgi:hypothetical protein